MKCVVIKDLQALVRKTWKFLVNTADPEYLRKSGSFLQIVDQFWEWQGVKRTNRTMLIFHAK